MNIMSIIATVLTIMAIIVIFTIVMVSNVAVITIRHELCALFDARFRPWTSWTYSALTVAHHYLLHSGLTSWFIRTDPSSTANRHVLVAGAGGLASWVTIVTDIHTSSGTEFYGDATLSWSLGALQSLHTLPLDQLLRAEASVQHHLM